MWDSSEDCGSQYKWGNDVYTLHFKNDSDSAPDVVKGENKARYGYAWSGGLDLATITV